MMKIGILGHGFLNWNGGVDFLRKICSSMAAQNTDLEIHFLVPVKGPRILLLNQLRLLKYLSKKLLGYKQTYPIKNYKKSLDYLTENLGVKVEIHEIDAGKSAIRNIAKGLRLDVVMPAIFPINSNIHMPTIGYIADFQHVHYPEFFSRKEIRKRNQRFSTILSTAKAVIVNGHAVEADIKNFMPNHKARIFVLPFCASPYISHFKTSDPGTEPSKKFGRYFIISNQFWQHKDHLTAFRALANLRKIFPEINIVCTGDTQDYRNPNYFGWLKTQADLLCISENLFILGLMPKHEQIELIRNSLAVIQPTLFEGGPGGGSVYDAVSLDVTAIISDIPINQEINEGNIIYFKAGSVESLTEKMREVIELGGRFKKSDDLLISEGHIRQKKCGALIFQAIEYVCGK
jgi:glycosyltransferase involved in cell wall biosynthesis